MAHEQPPLVLLTCVYTYVACPAVNPITCLSHSSQIIGLTFDHDYSIAMNILFECIELLSPHYNTQAKVGGEYRFSACVVCTTLG